MIDRLKLTNWKIHENTELNFKPGTNIIIGPMGSGKSSILQAISFALFVTFSELKKHDVKITELVNNKFGAQEAHIDLQLTHQDAPLRVTKKVDSDKGVMEASVRDGEEKMIAGLA